MSKFSLNPEINTEVIARFISKGNSEGLTGDAYTVRLFDKDLFNNDFIGESGLDANGYAKIFVSRSAFADFAGLETLPDLFFVVYKNGVVIFTSKVIIDTGLTVPDQYKKGEGALIDLGAYLIDA